VGRYPTADQLLEEAVEQTGLTDFGPGDFRDGLAALLDSLERDGDLDPSTDADVVGEFRRRLVNRLEAEAWYATHPEVEDVTVRGPVDIN
jgi:glyoxylase-like metal-dependent hydrolase (beta-lactamase superfamily II)